MKEVDANRLREEYSRLVQGLMTQGTLQAGAVQGGEDLLANPALPEDILQETVPGACAHAFMHVNISIVSLLLTHTCAHCLALCTMQT